MANYIFVDEDMIQSGSIQKEVSGSIQQQCDQRLTNLYNQSHTWLLQASHNICRSKIEAEELVSDLYVYLAKECRPHIWWGDSYNLIYLHRFLKHRWINRVDKVKRYQLQSEMDMGDAHIEYDEEKDNRIMEAYDRVKMELDNLMKTRNWAQAKLYQLYWIDEPEETLNDLAKKIGISKSTTFLAIKKIRKHLKEVIQNPFA